MKEFMIGALLLAIAIKPELALLVLAFLIGSL